VFLRTPQAPCIFEYISSTNSWEIACQALISRKSRHVSPFEEFTHRTPPQEHDSAPKGKIDNYVVKQWEAKKVQAHLGVSMAQVYLAKHRVGAVLKRELAKLEKHAKQ